MVVRILIGGPQEAHQRSIDLSDDGVNCIKTMIYYMYSLDYVLGAETMALHIQLTILADKYNIPHLASLAMTKLEDDLAMPKITAEDMIAAVRAAYETAGPTLKLRKLLVAAAVKAKFPFEVLEKAIGTHILFAGDVALALKKGTQSKEPEESKGSGQGVRFRCPAWPCARTFRNPAIAQDHEMHCCPVCRKARSGIEWHQHTITG